MKQNVMNFYTDDSPGLKISPVSFWDQDVGSEHFSRRAFPCERVFPVYRLYLKFSICSPLQVVVIGMSLGFILFVTILHFVGKVRQRGEPCI